MKASCGNWSKTSLIKTVWDQINVSAFPKTVLWLFLRVVEVSKGKLDCLPRFEFVTGLLVMKGTASMEESSDRN